MTRALHVVSHSHWDREWHQTFQQFRIRLIAMIDAVLKTLHDDPQFPAFMLDGQTIMLADYLEVRPQREAELRARIAEGRLQIGPWYVHPDEFLVSGEALVRNLLQGARDCGSWGGSMAIGYVPDQFGHIAQLPQILAGFGIEAAVLWRGVHRAEAGTAFTWEGHDGTSLLVAALPDGYNQAEHLPTGVGALATRLRALAASLEAVAEADQPLLIMNGGDHVTIQSGISSALTAAQDLLGDAYAVRHGTLPEYMAALRRAGQPSRTLRGELRDSRSHFLLPAVASSRMWIKQRNAEIQTLFERQAEPLVAIAAALAAQDHSDTLRQGWRYLLQNQPHDSICGCSIDQVHREMVTRFDWAEQIGRAVRDGALATLSAHVQSLVPGAEDPRTLAVTVFNGAPYPAAGRVDLRLHLAGDGAAYEVIDEHGQAVPHQWIGEHGEPPSTIDLPTEELPGVETIMAQVEGDRVMGLGLIEISMRTVAATLHVEATVGDQALLGREAIEQAARDAFSLIADAGCTRVSATIYRRAELHLAVHAPEVPPCGYRTLLLRPTSRPATGTGTEESTGALPLIENEHYRVEADADTGAVTIINRRSGLRSGPSNVFVDDGEAGDLYTHASPAIDAPIRPERSPRITRRRSALGESLEIVHTLATPIALEPSRLERASERVSTSIVTTVLLAPNDPLVRIHTTVDNRAQDHRLRVHMALPFEADHAHALDAFALIRRAAQPATVADWAEQPVGTAPHQGVVALHDATSAAAIAARGLPEYEVLVRDDNTCEIAITLLRCAGWLSRSDLAARPADAGPPLPTPEAQCPGIWEFDYAIAIDSGDWRALLPQTQAFAVALHAAYAPCGEGILPPSGSLVALTDPGTVLSAVKPAEDGEGLIVRVYSIVDRPTTTELRTLVPFAEAVEVDLAERHIRLLHAGGAAQSLELTVPPQGIVSVRLRWRS